MTIVERTCRELGADHPAPPARPLTEFRDRPAYVLLADPGAGKTTAFKQEVSALGGDRALRIDARDFISFDAEDHPEWRGRVLYIDGLDEVRAGLTDPREPLDRIRRNLDKLGRPPFRLSCRPADWLTTDQLRLGMASPTGEVTVVRLEPLDEKGAASLLEYLDEEPAAFIAKARERGMGGFLGNPLSLKLLAQAVARNGTGWPRTRNETFESACLLMAGEHNEEHLSVRPPHDLDRIVDTAGRICAALLISGTGGVATTAARATPDFPFMEACGRNEGAYGRAVGSKLFQHHAEGLAQPVHRHVAEYLAGRHIARLIAGGLPCGRVLALLCGPDGGVASGLRGLSAWLAVHSTDARALLIERDPTGVALYGDTEAFSHADRKRLFEALVREPRQLEPTYRTARAFRSLAGESMAEHLTRVLEPSDDPDSPLVVDFVLRVLSEAPPLAGLSPSLLGIARDGRRWPRVRHAALRAFIHYREGAGFESSLLTLLDDIHAGRVSDPDDRLLGMLLSTLYPGRISSAAVWDYFREGNELLGEHMVFWCFELPAKASGAGVADLLDACVDRLAKLERASDLTLGACVARLLIRGLEEHGDRVATGRLYDWLDAAIRLRAADPSSRSPGTDAIRAWVEARPDRQVELMLAGVARYPADHWYAPYEAFQRLFGATVAAGFYDRCARAAKSMVERRPGAAEGLLGFVARSGGLKPGELRDLVGSNARLSAYVANLLEPPPAAPGELTLERSRRARIADEARQMRRRLDGLRSNLHALRNNTAAPALLFDIGRAYFGGLLDVTADGGERRLREWVGQDPDLLDAALTGLRLTPDRDDIPDANAVGRARGRSRMLYLCWPYLAGLAERERAGSLVTWWTEERMRKALAAYFGYAHGEYEPGWYRELVAEHPATVAEVQVQIALPLLSKGMNVDAKLWHLAHDAAYAEVAQCSVLPLLRGFPPGAGAERLGVLNDLLLAALQHAERGVYTQEIRRQLARRSLAPRLRGRWLAAGLAVAVVEFEGDARAFIGAGRRQARAQHLASLFCVQERHVSAIRDADERLQGLLVELVGPFVDPSAMWAEGVATPAVEASECVSGCIRMLAANPSREATETISRLLADDDLGSWRHALASAADEQHLNRRNHEYRQPAFEEVVDVLEGGSPAGPADLAALVVDRLDVIAPRIRAGDTDDWKRFWNEDFRGRPTRPKHEDSCTDALLRELRTALPADITAIPQGHHANDARADIHVCHGDYRIPIEVKREGNRNLWRAAKTQLIDRYATDPATGGHGVYLVLWFGCEPVWTSEGQRVASPADLRRQLEAKLTHAERRTIAVRVLDVSGGRPIEPAAEVS